jgi:hypothetical protein
MVFEKSILEKFDFINQTKVIGEIHQLSTSTALIGDEGEILPILKDELKQSLFRKLFKDSLKVSNIEFLDLRTLGLESQSLVGFGSFSVSTREARTGVAYLSKMIDRLKNIQGKNLLTNVRLSADLSDSSQFYVHNTLSSGALPYLIGSLSGKNLWIDPFIRYDENFILIFDSIDLEIVDINKSINNNSPNIPSQMEVHLDYKFSISNPSVLYIFTNDNQNNLSILVSTQRDERIDQILDETEKIY